VKQAVKKRLPRGYDPMTVTEIEVDHIDVGDRHRKDMGDLSELIESIRAVGLLQPIIVGRSVDMQHYPLIAGERRLRAVQALGWKTIPAYHALDLKDAAALLRAEHDENTCRKDFTPTEAVAIGEALEEMERPKAQARLTAGVNQHTEPSGKLPEGSRGDTRDKVAAAVGMSGKTYEKAKQVVEAAKEDPQQFGDLPEVMDESGSVHKAHVEMKRRQNGKAEDTEPQTNGEIKSRGVGITRAEEAIDCLKRIPKNDALRKRGFQQVTDWIWHQENGEAYAPEQGTGDALKKWRSNLEYAALCVNQIATGLRRLAKKPKAERHVQDVRDLLERARRILNRVEEDFPNGKV